MYCYDLNQKYDIAYLDKTCFIFYDKHSPNLTRIIIEKYKGIGACNTQIKYQLKDRY